MFGFIYPLALAFGIRNSGCSWKSTPVCTVTLVDMPSMCIPKFRVLFTGSLRLDLDKLTVNTGYRRVYSINNPPIHLATDFEALFL